MVVSQDILITVQGTKRLFPFPPGTAGHLHQVTESQQSSLSISKDLGHLQSNEICISSQGTLDPSPNNQQLLQNSESSKGFWDHTSMTVAHIAIFLLSQML